MKIYPQLTAPVALIGQRVRVYRNTRDSGISVCHRGRVVANVLYLYLYGPTLATRVGKSGTLHSYVTGIVTDNSDASTQTEISKFVGIGTRFVDSDTGENSRNTGPVVTVCLTYYC